MRNISVKSIFDRIKDSLLVFSIFSKKLCANVTTRKRIKVLISVLIAYRLNLTQNSYTGWWPIARRTLVASDVLSATGLNSVLDCILKLCYC